MEKMWKRIYQLGTLRNEISEELLEPLKERARNIFLDTNIEYELDLDNEVIRSKKMYVDTYYYVYICVQEKDEKLALYYIDKFLKEEKIELSKIMTENETFDDEENL